MPPGAKRNKTLYGMGKKRGKPHRYVVVRWSLGIALTILVALMPLTGFLRFDLWSGRNMWLGERRGLVEVAKAFGFPFLAINIAIIVTSRFLGRWLCGFGCPIGNLNRLSEWLQWRFRKRLRWLGTPILLLLCLLLGAITFSFWVDWRVFRDGSTGAIVLSSLFLGGTTLVLFGVVRGLGMAFCRDYCPSGVYFALLGNNSLTGIEFASPESCTECKACETVCPVDLEPRHMLAGTSREARGLYPEHLSDLANCLRCGDCIVVCEDTTSKDPLPTPLRLGWLPPQARESQGEAAPESGEHSKPHA